MTNTIRQKIKRDLTRVTAMSDLLTHEVPTEREHRPKLIDVKTDEYINCMSSVDKIDFERMFTDRNYLHIKRIYQHYKTLLDGVGFKWEDFRFFYMNTGKIRLDGGIVQSTMTCCSYREDISIFHIGFAFSNSDDSCDKYIGKMLAIHRILSKTPNYSVSTRDLGISDASLLQKSLSTPLLVAMAYNSGLIRIPELTKKNLPNFDIRIDTSDE